MGNIKANTYAPAQTICDVHEACYWMCIDFNSFARLRGHIMHGIKIAIGFFCSFKVNVNVSAKEREKEKCETCWLSFGLGCLRTHSMAKIRFSGCQTSSSNIALIRQFHTLLQSMLTIDIKFFFHSSSSVLVLLLLKRIPLPAKWLRKISFLFFPQRKFSRMEQVLNCFSRSK